MAEKFLYEFDGFRVDPSRGVLFLDERQTELRAKPFKLLLALVENHGQSITKEELMSHVWPGSLVTDDNFHVNLDAVRKALGESGRQPHFIFRTDDGYKFVAEVKVISIEGREEIGIEIPPSVSGPAEEQHVATMRDESQIIDPGVPSSAHLAHILVSSTLYAALYGSAVLLEIAYQFDRFRDLAFTVAAIVFGWIISTSVAGLVTNRKRISRNRNGGFAVTVVVFFGAAACVFIGLMRFLPNEPITQAAFQTYPAQAAYLKDVAYFLALALLFLIIPFHFVSTMTEEIHAGRYRSVLDTLTARKLAVLPGGTIYLGFGHLALVLLLFAVMSIAMTAHLMDNLESGTYRNLFTQLVYLRGILYFGLGIECLCWYYNALSDLKRECIILLNQ